MSVLFKKILIANRSEIAIRIMHTCKELNIQTVAIYSTEDKDALHVHLADEKICIGPASASLSYLNIKAIMSAAELTQPDAIHPGVGFLAENAHFADVVTSHNMAFIGPTSNNMRMFSNKQQVKKIMQQYAIPTIPSSNIIITDFDTAQQAAQELQYPLMLKSPFCGGGKGMRIAYSSSNLQQAYQDASLEAKTFSGKSDLFAEAYLENMRHIEFQICFDKYGNGVHLYERDCSLQRNNQKILEETPSIMPEPIKMEILSKIMIMLRDHKYVGVGTLEFLYHPHTQKYFFMEMNARLQIEHTITEEITGIDLVRLQIMISAGMPIDIEQKDVQIRGHAIQCRINSEDPYSFMPSTSMITEYLTPTGIGIRVDSAAYRGMMISAYYDSLLSKLIVHAQDRHAAFMRMHRALSQYIIQGPKTLIPLHMQLCSHQDILQNTHHTQWLSRYIEAIQKNE